MMIPYLTSGILTPIVGYITDLYGHRLQIFIAGNMLLLSFYVIYFFLPDNTSQWYAYITLFIFGIFQGIMGIIWIFFPLIVKEEYLGIAFGCVSVIDNVFLATVPLLNGWLHDIVSTKKNGKWVKEDYSLVMVSMASLTIIGTGLLIWLYKIDGGRNGVLSKK